MEVFMKRIVPMALVGILVAQAPIQAGLLDFFRNPKPVVYTHPKVDRVVNAIVTPKRVKTAGLLSALGVVTWAAYNYKTGIKKSESKNTAKPVQPSLTRRIAHNAIVGTAYIATAALIGHGLYRIVKAR